MVVNDDRGVEDAVAVAGDAIETCTRHLGHEPMRPQFDDESRDALAATVRFFDRLGWSCVEAGGEVMVAEPGDGVLAGEHRAE